MINDVVQRVQALLECECALFMLRINIIRNSLSNNTIRAVALIKSMNIFFKKLFHHQKYSLYKYIYHADTERSQQASIVRLCNEARSDAGDDR